MGFQCKLLLNLLVSLSVVRVAVSTPSFFADRNVNHGEKMRGVNLGGWLVLEPWITPSIFDEAGDAAIDEYTLSQTLGPSAKARLTKHWESFITKDDFPRIAAAGLTHVRIPIGYWAVHPIEGEPYVQGQLEYFDRAVEWAREAKLKVIVDLHGAPGSQNGFDNSGRKGPVKWQTGQTVEQTLQAIRKLSERYAPQSDVVSAIELLNEPFPQQGVKIEPLKQFYHDGAGIVSETNPETNIILSDAFQGVIEWNGFMAGRPNTILDHHHYQVFVTDMLPQPIDQRVGTACGLGKSQLSQGDKPNIVGEWCGALTDCARYLNGKGEGARYDGTHSTQSNPELARPGGCEGKSTGSVAGLPEEYKVDMRRYIEAQLDAFEMGHGWVWWTWTTEGAPEWDMQQLIEGGIFPQPPQDRRYPGQCG